MIRDACENDRAMWLNTSAIIHFSPSGIVKTKYLVGVCLPTTYPPADVRSSMRFRDALEMEAFTRSGLDRIFRDRCSGYAQQSAFADQVRVLLLCIDRGE